MGHILRAYWKAGFTARVLTCDDRLAGLGQREIGIVLAPLAVRSRRGTEANLCLYLFMDTMPTVSSASRSTTRWRANIFRTSENLSPVGTPLFRKNSPSFTFHAACGIPLRGQGHRMLQSRATRQNLLTCFRFAWGQITELLIDSGIGNLQICSWYPFQRRCYSSSS